MWLALLAKLSIRASPSSALLHVLSRHKVSKFRLWMQTWLAKSSRRVRFNAVVFDRKLIFTYSVLWHLAAIDWPIGQASSVFLSAKYSMTNFFKPCYSSPAMMLLKITSITELRTS